MDTASERVAIAAAVEGELKERERRGRPKTKWDDDVLMDEIGNMPWLKEKGGKNSTISKGQKTREVAAERAGFGNETTYRQAKSVVQHGVPELVEAMDSNVISISKAAKIAKQEPDEQRKAVYDPAHYDRIIKESKAAIEATKTPSVRIGYLVDAFQEIATSKTTPGKEPYSQAPCVVHGRF